MAHPWHDVALPEDADLSEFPAVIEIPRGEKNKYEIDKDTGLLRVDRVLFSSVHYPHNFEAYKTLEHKDAEVGDRIDRDEAVRVVRAGAARYREHYR